MTEASRCICTLICPLTGPATDHCPGNGLGHLRIVEWLNVHIISLQLIIHGYVCEHWLIATEPYDRIPTELTRLNETFRQLLDNGQTHKNEIVCGNLAEKKVLEIAFIYRFVIIYLETIEIYLLHTLTYAHTHTHTHARALYIYIYNSLKSVSRSFMLCM